MSISPNTTSNKTEEPVKPEAKKEHHFHLFHHSNGSNPKGFENDAMRSSKSPDFLYQFDDPMARRLGPVPSTDPTNTGA
ncbi:hypothetical protein EDC96DRAFT_516195 [Choanephora cucurbitarum]|nr:hypothetical protein EDC96DRAFT_516195 [Choanephora cucurbitarum]